jgi:hypothetical protein
MLYSPFNQTFLQWRMNGMIKDLVEHYVNQTKDIKEKAVIIKLNDMISNIL